MFPIKIKPQRAVWLKHRTDNSWLFRIIMTLQMSQKYTLTHVMFSSNIPRYMSCSPVALDSSTWSIQNQTHIRQRRPEEECIVVVLYFSSALDVKLQWNRPYDHFMSYKISSPQRIHYSSLPDSVWLHRDWRNDSVWIQGLWLWRSIPCEKDKIKRQFFWQDVTEVINGRNEVGPR